jgi:hypothetical protein
MKKLLVMGLLALCILISPVLAAEIHTDKPDYAPEMKVTIYGSGFNPGSVTIIVTRPGPIIDSLSAPVNSLGDFTAIYQLDGIEGTYTVSATDSTGLNAQTTFTDCVPPNIPEFPTMFVPVAMVIGILGAALLIQRTREH